MDSVTLEKVERCAAALYWVGFRAREADKALPHLTPEMAWKRAGPVQQEFCRQQAMAVIQELAKS